MSKKKDIDPPMPSDPSHLPEVVFRAFPRPRNQTFVTVHLNVEELTNHKFDAEDETKRKKFLRGLCKSNHWPLEWVNQFEQKLISAIRVPCGESGQQEDETKSSGNDRPKPTRSGYLIVGGHTYHYDTSLANFSATITGQTISDDGVEQTRELIVLAKHHTGSEVSASVPVSQFEGLGWVLTQLGPSFVVQAGSGKREHLRCAIQELSGDTISSTTLYRHSGWRVIDSQWNFLHAGGAIGPSGQRVSVKLEGSAEHFSLPPPPRGDSLLQFVHSSLSILGEKNRLAPDPIIFSLVSSSYRAALGNDPDFSPYLHGPTGVQKSELAALAQQHFGAAMNRSHLPGNWSSTGNSLEALAFVLKDALFVIDDFAPSASRQDHQRLQTAADRIFRGSGNRSGRGRARVDGSARAHKPPRGLVFGTGEDLPSGHSLNSRLCPIEVQQGDVDLRRLSECQSDALSGKYSASMSAFLHWLAPQYASVVQEMEATRIQLRDEFLNKFPHARSPDIIANMLLGLRFFLKFSEAIGVIDREQNEKLSFRGRNAFALLMARQKQDLESLDPVLSFSRSLTSIITSGKGHIAAIDDGPPPFASSWGWSVIALNNGESSCRSHGDRIGWVYGDELYLNPEVTHKALCQLSREKDKTYPISQSALFGRLKKAGHLLKCQPDRTTWPVKISSRTLDVVVFSTTYLSTPGHKPGKSGLVNGKSDSVRSYRIPGFESETGKVGNDGNGNPTSENELNGKPGKRNWLKSR